MTRILVALLLGCSEAPDAKDSHPDRDDSDEPGPDTGEDTSADTGDSGEPAVPPACSTEPYVKVDLGAKAGCGIRADGCMDCWSTIGDGDDEDWFLEDHGLGVAPAGTWSEVSLSKGPTRPDEGVYVAEAQFGACALGPDGGARCWGWPYDAPWDWETWREVPGDALGGVATGFRHACALAADETVRCWGACVNGACDAPDGTYVQVVSGHDFSCALDPEGAVDCWGFDDDLVTPGEVEPERDVWSAGPYTRIYAGTGDTCGLGPDDVLRCMPYYHWDYLEEYDSLGVDGRSIVVGSVTYLFARALLGLDADGNGVTVTEEGGWDVPHARLFDEPLASLAAGDLGVCAIDLAGDLACAFPDAWWGNCPYCTDVYYDED